MSVSYVLNLFIILLTISYGIYLMMYRIKNERIYTIKRTVIQTISGLLFIQIFYRFFIYILDRPLGILDLNHLHYYEVIAYGNNHVFINVFFLPAFLIFGFESYRMISHSRHLEQKIHFQFIEGDEQNE
jgi:hypothetical protein